MKYCYEKKRVIVNQCPRKKKKRLPIKYFVKKINKIDITDDFNMQIENQEC